MALMPWWYSACPTSQASMGFQTNLSWTFCVPSLLSYFLFFPAFFLHWCVPVTSTLAVLWLLCRARSERCAEGEDSWHIAALLILSWSSLNVSFSGIRRADPFALSTLVAEVYSVFQVGVFVVRQQHPTAHAACPERGPRDFLRSSSYEIRSSKVSIMW